MEILSNHEFKAIDLKKPSAEHWGEIPERSETDAIPKLLPVAAGHVFAESERIKKSVYNEAMGSWEAVPFNTMSRADGRLSIIGGTNFAVKGASLYGYGRRGEEERISNATVRIVKRILLFGKNASGEPDESYELEIRCDAWGADDKSIEVSKAKYRDVFNILRKEYPEVTLFDNRSKAVEEYLAAVAEADLPKAFIEKRYWWMGWHDNEGDISYGLGVNPVYTDYEIPAVSVTDRYRTFRDGCGFIGVAKDGNFTGLLLMLYAHMPYILYWLDSSGIDFNGILYLNGRSNTFKTATTTVLANPFIKNRKLARMSLGSTEAAARRYLLMGNDTLLLLDDSSSTQRKRQNGINLLMERAIRTVSDGAGEAVADKHEGIVHKRCRNCLILTGETTPDLGNSSHLRLIELPVDEDTFDPAELATFQRDPALMARYFALWIGFLTTAGPELVSSATHHYAHIREGCRRTGEVSVPRFIDDLAGLLLLSDIWGQFAMWSGCSTDDAGKLVEMFKNAAWTAIHYNQELSEQEDDAVSYIRLFFQGTNTVQGFGLADSEEAYKGHEREYVGFIEESTATVWVRPEDSMRIVIRLSTASGKTFNCNLPQLKQKLAEKGFIKVVKKGNRTQFVHRGKTGERKHFMVLYKAKIDAVLGD